MNFQFQEMFRWILLRRRTICSLTLLVFVGLGCAAWAAEPANKKKSEEQSVLYPTLPDDGIQWKFEQPPRVVAIGDIHADPDALLAILQDRKLINDQGEWIGGKTHLVFTGDLMDRGPDSRSVLDIVLDLTSQAEKAGGMVHALNGNHDIMVQQGDVRYLSRADTEQYRDFRKSRKKISEVQKISPLMRKPEAAVVVAQTGDSKYAEWNRTRNSMIQIGDTLYIHGGPSRWALNADPGAVNSTVRAWVKFFHGGPEPEAKYEWALDRSSPFWSTSASEGFLPNPTLAKILRDLGAKRVVVGHVVTDTNEIETKYNEKLIKIDTGISRVYGGKLSALEFDAKGKWTAYDDIPRPEGRHPLRERCEWGLAGI